MKVVVYTVVTNGYDTLHQQPEQDVRCDWVAFTDDAFPYGEPRPWQRRHAGPYLDHSDNPRRGSRVLKCRPWDALDNTDVAVWVDGNAQVLRTDFVEWAVDHLGESDGLVAWRHPERDDIGAEASYVEHLQRDTGWAKYVGQPQHEQMRAYREHGLPYPSGLFGCGCLVWDLRKPKARALGTAWFEEQKMWDSDLDQLSLPFVAWRAGFTVGVFDANEYVNDYVRFGVHVVPERGVGAW